MICSNCNQSFSKKTIKEGKCGRCRGIRKSVPKKIREELWRKRCGNVFESRCYVCDGTVNALNFEAGHILSVKEGGKDVIDNLKVCCVSCNRGMGSMHMEEYKTRRFPKSCILPVLSALVLVLIITSEPWQYFGIYYFF